MRCLDQKTLILQFSLQQGNPPWCGLAAFDKIT